VAGRKVWTLREKAIKLISEAKMVVSVLDEAFTILALMNYWERWTGKGKTARWTDSKAGNYQYMDGQMWPTFNLMNCANEFVNSARPN
jgi:hypothetical protein